MFGPSRFLTTGPGTATTAQLATTMAQFGAFSPTEAAQIATVLAVSALMIVAGALADTALTRP